MNSSVQMGDNVKYIVDVVYITAKEQCMSLGSISSLGERCRVSAKAIETWPEGKLRSLKDLVPSRSNLI